jgi:hypothetical protein
MNREMRDTYVEGSKEGVGGTDSGERVGAEGAEAEGDSEALRLSETKVWEG